MNVNVPPTLEFDEDIQILKEYTLLPLLLDTAAKDSDVEQFIWKELQRIRSQMKKKNIRVLKTEMSAKGVYAEYKVRGYIHRFSMLRSLIKAELRTMLMDIRRRIG